MYENSDYYLPCRVDQCNVIWKQKPKFPTVVRVSEPWNEKEQSETMKKYAAQYLWTPYLQNFKNAYRKKFQNTFITKQKSWLIHLANTVSGEDLLYFDWSNI